MARVLVTVLDWGLGHATRSIPVIRLLLQQNHNVYIAGSGESLKLLRLEFPDLPVRELPGYRPKYPRGKAMVWKMLVQLPKFINTIREEHEVIEQIVSELNIDVVISDNRYGCWSSRATSVLITHQSNILMPRRFGWLSPWVRKLNVSHMELFDFLWVPDFPTEDPLAGELISFGEFKVNCTVHFIGHLSRFKRNNGVEKKYDVVAICSGPEPQRTILERMFRTSLKDSGLSYILIQGIFNGYSIEDIDESSNVVPFLPATRLQKVFEEAKLVLSRSGFSTIMDLDALGCKAVFVPTPGQTEQEYLAKRLMDQGIAFSMEQTEFNLDVALEKALSYKGFSGRSESDLLAPALRDVLKFVKRKRV